MASIRWAMPWMPLAAASAASPASVSAARARLRSCCSASLASDNSSAMTSAASSSSRASPTWPTLLTNSPTRASTYCASRRMRGSCPSSQVILYGRPLTVTDDLAHLTPSPQAPGRPGRARRRPGRRSRRRRRAAAGFRLGRGRRAVPPRSPARTGAGGFEPRHGAFEAGERLVEPAHPRQPPPCRARARSAHPLVFLQRADVVGARLVREELRPLRPRHLADIEVAAAVDGQPVRAEKRGRRGPGMHVAEPRQQLALIVDDADPRARGSGCCG